MGFCQITLVDHDVIEPANCNRLYYADDPSRFVGRPKAKALAQAARRLHRDIHVVPVRRSVLDDQDMECLQAADIVVLAVDNDAARAVVNRHCAQYGTPLVNVASGISMDGSGSAVDAAGCQVQWFLPREPDYPCLECQGGLDYREIEAALGDADTRLRREQAGYVLGTDLSPAPQVMPLNGVAASLASWQIAMWATGAARPDPYLYVDLVTRKMASVSVTGDAECSICGAGDISVLARGDLPDPAALVETT
jgi:hypothetical protein